MEILILIGVAVVALAAFFVLRGRKAAPPPRAEASARGRTAPEQRRRDEAKPPPQAPPAQAHADDERPVHIEVDEIHFGDENDLLSTSERHIGDTQPMDREHLAALKGKDDSKRR